MEPSHRPKQLTLVTLVLTTGTWLTVMVKLAGAPLQFPFAPVTVYTVVDAGLSVLVLPEPVGSQVYVVAPVMFTVTDEPLQIVVLLTEAPMFGVVFTVMLKVAVELQLPLEPVTVYTVVVVGVTAITVVVKAPGCHE